MPDNHRSFTRLCAVMLAAALVFAAPATGQILNKGLSAHMAYGNALYAKDYRMALAALGVVLQEDATLLEEPDERNLVGLFSLVPWEGEGAVVKAAVLEIMIEREWRPKSPRISVGGLWSGYAEYLLKEGHPQDALDMVRRIEFPGSIQRLRVDRRFAPLVQANPQLFDVRRVAVARLTKSRAEAQASPNSLRATMSLVGDLLYLGRTEEAGRLVDAAIQRIETRARPRFTDQEEMIGWLWDDKARLLKNQGRFDEALEALRKAAAQSDNISHRLNLGAHLVLMGRAAEARRTVSNVYNWQVSDYGEQVEAWIRVCANAALGDEKAARAALAPIKEDGPWRFAFGCLDDKDELARRVIRLLDKEVGLPAPLPPSPPLSKDDPLTPLEQRLEAVFTEVRARPDVKAAYARAGRPFPATPQDDREILSVRG